MPIPFTSLAWLLAITSASGSQSTTSIVSFHRRDGTSLHLSFSFTQWRFSARGQSDLVVVVVWRVGGILMERVLEVERNVRLGRRLCRSVKDFQHDVTDFQNFLGGM